MKATVFVYNSKEDYVFNEPAYGEEYYSITEAINEVKKDIAKIRKINRKGGNAFLGCRVYDSLGDLKHELPSETVTEYSIQFLQTQRERQERGVQRERDLAKQESLSKIAN